MEKKDAQILINGIDSVNQRHENLCQELKELVDKAFAAHGGVFEFKCDTHPTWQQRDDEGELEVSEDLCGCVTVWIEDDGGHELYPTVIRQYTDDCGFRQIEADGYDWNESEWVEYQQLGNNVDDLLWMTGFIKACLAQEHN